MCFVALAGVVGAVAVRPATSPADDAHTAPSTGADGATLLAHESGRFQVAVGATTAGSRDVWLLPSEPLDIPDLLVYAVQGASDAAELPSELPSGAKLLGPAAQASSTKFSVAESDGALLLFSLAHQAVEATITLSAAPDAATKGDR